MSSNKNISRRDFVLGLTIGSALSYAPSVPSAALAEMQNPSPRPYGGPNVVIIRFGGGVRRLETIDSENTYAPYFLHELCPRGTLFSDVFIDQLQGAATSHGQGTLHILTGRYGAYTDVNEYILGERFEPKVPTLFESLRKEFDIPAHQTLIINGEDRNDEEFYTFSNHHLFGVRYRSNVLSLYWYKTYLLGKQLEEGVFSGKELEEKIKELEELRALDVRSQKPEPSKDIDRFWAKWRKHFGSSGFVNPRGDRLLTELSLRALAELRPRLMMINYQDPDYVHWGFASHYTHAVSIIDQGIKQLVEFCERDEFYRGNTIFVVVPDCGRDSNPFQSVPFQHHFNSRSAREIFALFVGPGIPKGKRVDKRVQQVSVASTIAQMMGFKSPYVEESPLAI